MRIALLFFLLTWAALAMPAVAPPDPGQSGPQTVDVWPGTAPGETTSSAGRVTNDHSGNVTRLTDVTRPQLLLYPAAGSGTHPTILVCPGGGYGILSVDLEGDEIARWLNGLGYSAAVLHYRVPGKREAAFADAQRAISLLRSHTGDWGVDIHHVGVIGFSAGGHLAARLASGFLQRTYAPVDSADRASCRPDFAALVYPAYLIDKKTGQPAPEVQPASDMPPLFLTQTRDDPYFDVEGYAKALQAAGVPAKCVIYDTGHHGYGLRLPASLPAHHWPDEAAAWLRTQCGPAPAAKP